MWVRIPLPAPFSKQMRSLKLALVILLSGFLVSGSSSGGSSSRSSGSSSSGRSSSGTSSPSRSSGYSNPNKSTSSSSGSSSSGSSKGYSNPNKSTTNSSTSSKGYSNPNKTASPPSNTGKGYSNPNTGKTSSSSNPYKKPSLDMSPTKPMDKGSDTFRAVREVNERLKNTPKVSKETYVSTFKETNKERFRNSFQSEPVVKPSYIPNDYVGKDNVQRPIFYYRGSYGYHDAVGNFVVFDPLDYMANSTYTTYQRQPNVYVTSSSYTGSIFSTAVITVLLICAAVILLGSLYLIFKSK